MRPPGLEPVRDHPRSNNLILLCSSAVFFCKYLSAYLKFLALANASSFTFSRICVRLFVAG